MRAVLGIVSLLVVLATVGLLGKKLVGGTAGGAPAGTAAAPLVGGPQVQQQVQQALESALQQPRPVADEK